MRLIRLIVCPLLGCFLLSSLSTRGIGAIWNPDADLGNPEQHQRLYEIARAYCEINFDPDAEMVGTPIKNPPNKKYHPVRESAYYAYGLLLTGDPADRARAQAILKRVVAAQDTQADSPTCGVFYVNVEDDKPSDMNWAAFVGLDLAAILDLDRQHPSLDPDLRSQVKNSCRLAVEEVMRRDVEAGYTNIAFLSIALTAAGEKLLAVPGAGAFAQAKLDAVLARTGDGDFTEYLSPTYSGADLEGAYMARKFAFSDAFASKADAAIDHLWKQIAASYHAPTFQLAGPHSRAYGNDMLQYTALLKYDLYLALGGAYPLPDTETEHDWDKPGLFIFADLPIKERPEFKVPPPPWREWTVGPNQPSARHLTQYREGNFILGTISPQDEFKQRQNLVAYWRNDDTSPDGFRVGFCIDESNTTLAGFPGEKLHFYSQQEKGNALVAIVSPAALPETGGCSLVFDSAAAVMDGKGTLPIRIQDGSITAYLYPISAGTSDFESQSDTQTLRLTRLWKTADSVNSLNVLAYLIVFRPSDAPAPNVSGLGLKVQGDGAFAEAQVDGTPLSVSFKN